MKAVQILPDTTDWVAVYKVKDQEEELYTPLMGWVMTDAGEVVALVPSSDGRAVACDNYTGEDGELTFDRLTCSHECTDCEGEET